MYMIVRDTLVFSMDCPLTLHSTVVAGALDTLKKLRHFSILWEGQGKLNCGVEHWISYKQKGSTNVLTVIAIIFLEMPVISSAPSTAC